MELATVCERYGTDLRRRNLELQLSVFRHSLLAGCDCLSDILEHMSNFSPAQRDLMKEVCTLASLILVMPATNASSERSFSGLRRVKTYLRSTMGQIRLNSLMLLSAHLNPTDSLNLSAIGNAFAQGSEHRQSIFGTFLPSLIWTELCSVPHSSSPSPVRD